MAPCERQSVRIVSSFREDIAFISERDFYHLALPESRGKLRQLQQEVAVWSALANGIGKAEIAATVEHVGRDWRPLRNR
jgi:hypothetical protein